MSRSLWLRRAAWLGAPLVGVVTAGLLGTPAASATDPLSVSLVLAPGQSGSIGRVVSDTDVTPVSTCDTGLSVSFDATMAGTVTVAPGTPVGSYTCSVDFQIVGQSVGLVEHVSVTVLPGLSIDDVGEAEGTPAEPPFTQHVNEIGELPTLPHEATFTVTMSVPSPTVVTVDVATADGTATAPDDYTAASTTLTFQPGQTSATVSVTLTPDNIDEFEETFTVTLSAATGALITDGQATGFILDDDNPNGVEF